MARTSILGKVAVSLGMSSKGFEKGLKSAELSLKRFSKKAERMGQNLTVGVTAPLAGLATKSIMLFDKQAKSIAQVEAGLKSTGMAVGFTSKQLQQMASDLQGVSLFGDEDILKNVTANLLTFTNIAGQEFAQTQQAVLDLATRMDGDLKSAAIQLGKALNDPVANLSALSRSGIQFSDSQKSVIKDLVETNRLADAQNIILKELQTQFGGSAQAAREAGAGGLQALSNSFGDLLERVGKALLPTLNKLVSFFDGMVKKLDGLTDKQIAFNVALAGVAAAVGPALIILAKLSKVVLALNTPLGLTLAAVGGIAMYVVKNWDKVSVQIVQVANKMIDLYNESAFVRSSLESIKFIGGTAFKVLEEGLDSFTPKLIASGKAIMGIINLDPKAFFEGVSQWASLMADSIVNMFKVGSDEASKAIDNIVNQRVKLLDENLLKQQVDDFVDYLVSGVQGAKKEIDSALTKKALTTPSFSSKGLLDGDASKFKQVKIKPQMVEQFTDLTATQIANVQSLAQGFDAISESFARTFVDGVADLKNFGDAWKAFGKSVVGALKEIAVQLVKMAALKGLASLFGLGGITTSFGLAEGLFQKFTGTKVSAPVTAGKQAVSVALNIDGQNVRTSYEQANKRYVRVTGG